MHSHFKQVGEFMSTFDQEVNEKFTSPDLDTIKLRLELILEEFIELFEGTTKSENPSVIATKATLMAASKGIGELQSEDILLNHIEIADALSDIEYVTLGAGHTFGVNLDATFDEVQSSNMSKLGADGKPIYREDGKVMKGPNYRKPDLAKVLYQVGCIPGVSPEPREK
jgi:predicted HAD superfamily Cof-like phosphohydrolase